LAAFEHYSPVKTWDSEFGVCLRASLSEKPKAAANKKIELLY
jgi:hypothetical protein